MYLDSAYIAKYYVNEPDASAVRSLIAGRRDLRSSSWASLEVTSVFHRHVRERSLTAEQGQELMDLFQSHVAAGIWKLAPVTDSLLMRTTRLVRDMPGDIPLRAGDAVHIATALDLGEEEIWTNDRHLLAAAPHFGIAGRNIQAVSGK